MNIQLQYSVKIVEDHDKLKWNPGPYNVNNIVENTTRDAFVLAVLARLPATRPIKQNAP